MTTLPAPHWYCFSLSIESVSVPHVDETNNKKLIEGEINYVNNYLEENYLENDFSKKLEKLSSETFDNLFLL